MDRGDEAYAEFTIDYTERVFRRIHVTLRQMIEH